MTKTAVQLKVRLRPPLHAKIVRAAQEEGLSMNSEIVARLDRSFTEVQKPGTETASTMPGQGTGVDVPDGRCEWCSQGATTVYHYGPCPCIASVEYFPDGTVKRVEFRDSTR